MELINTHTNTNTHTHTYTNTLSLSLSLSQAHCKSIALRKIHQRNKGGWLETLLKEMSFQILSKSCLRVRMAETVMEVTLDGGTNMWEWSLTKCLGTWTWNFENVWICRQPTSSYSLLFLQSSPFSFFFFLQQNWWSHCVCHEPGLFRDIQTTLPIDGHYRCSFVNVMFYAVQKCCSHGVVFPVNRR